MDRRRAVQRWLDLREREGLTYRELSRRSGIPANTLTHWAWRLRKESRPEPRAFVELVPAEDARRDSRVEIIVRGERRVLVDPSIEPETLTRILSAVERC